MERQARMWPSPLTLCRHSAPYSCIQTDQLHPRSSTNPLRVPGGSGMEENTRWGCPKNVTVLFPLPALSRLGAPYIATGCVSRWIEGSATATDWPSMPSAPVCEARSGLDGHRGLFQVWILALLPSLHFPCQIPDGRKEGHTGGCRSSFNC